MKKVAYIFAICMILCITGCKGGGGAASPTANYFVPEGAGGDPGLVQINGPIDNDGAPAPVPEPATIALLGFGLLGLARMKKNIRK